MTTYEQLRQQHYAEAMARVPGMIDRLSWPADRLAAHRRTQLQQLVQVAVEGSPWHRKRLRYIDPDALADGDVAALPTMTKADLMEYFNEVVTDERLRLDVVDAHLDSEQLAAGSYLLGRYTAIASGGSTGRRGVFVYDWDGWTVVWVGLFRYLFRAMRTDPELIGAPPLMANVTASHPTHATAAFNRTFTGPHMTALRFPVTLPVEDIVAGLNETQPTFLHAYPSALHLLAAEAAAHRSEAGHQQFRAAASRDPGRRRRSLGCPARQLVGRLRGRGDRDHVRRGSRAPQRRSRHRRTGGREQPAGSRRGTIGQDPAHQSVQSHPAADPI
ncbi:MAG TPA: hypothetical protein VG034_17820 [Acidimicrobiia bacterium]|nr:hypothetical protein [Acidimicrobiia bacterium]